MSAVVPPDPFPTYDELQRRTDGRAGTAWGVFGPHDELGTLNHLTEERVRAAVASVRQGARFSLDHVLDAFDPPLAPTRQPLRHHLFASNPFHRDEHLESFYTQSSSQIDGLRHIGHPELGFYGGVDPTRFTPADPLLGVARFAEHGVVGRGVLVDVEAHRARLGRPIDHEEGEVIGVADVVDAIRTQGTPLRPGDILLLRTGWAGHRLTSPPAPDAPLRATGLRADHETAAWLWDERLAVVATDTFAVESWPARDDSPFVTDAEREGLVARSSHTGLLHRVLIPLLGMALGELWALDELAAACARDGRWECLVIAVPLRLRGGAGSPSNAMAIR